MLLQTILLQAGTTPPPAGQSAQQGNPFGMLFMMGAIVIVFYFFMIRPQQKRQREERAFRDGLKKGDKVITIGGIYGKVLSNGDEGDGSLLIEVDSNVKLRVDKSALRAAPLPAGETPK